MQAAQMTHPWKATQHRGFIEKVVLEGQAIDGRTWASDLRAEVDAPGDPITSFTIEVVDNDPDEPGNVVLYFKLSATQTALLPAVAHWDVRQSYPDTTEPVPLLKGTIETEKAVTRSA